MSFLDRFVYKVRQVTCTIQTKTTGNSQCIHITQNPKKQATGRDSLIRIKAGKVRWWRWFRERGGEVRFAHHSLAPRAPARWPTRSTPQLSCHKRGAMWQLVSHANTLATYRVATHQTSTTSCRREVLLSLLFRESKPGNGRGERTAAVIIPIAPPSPRH